MDSNAGIMIKKFSDHQPYFLCLDLTYTKQSKTQFVRIRHENPDNLRRLMAEIDSENILDKIEMGETVSPCNNYSIMNTIVQKAIANNIPVKLVKFHKHKHKNSKWITKGLIRSIEFRDKLYVRLKKTKPDTHEHYTLKTNLHTYNSMLKKMIRTAKKSYYDNCFEKNKCDLRKTWSTISEILSKSRNKRTFPRMFKEDGQTFIDKVTIANRFNAYFTRIGPNLAQNIIPPQHKSFRYYLKGVHNTVFKFHEVNCEIVDKIIDSLKPKSSCGWDGISVRLMKQIKGCILQPVSVIINQMLQTGIFPNDLKIAKVIPLFKKGDESLFENYRPISLLPTVSKVFEKVIYIQLYEYFKQNNLFYDNQYGFRTGHSTEMAALELIDRLYQAMDNGTVPFCIYLDLSKAFDTLNHDILLEKLCYYGIQNTELKLFKSYLSERQQFVDIEGTKSSTLSLSTGVPQGSILGPLLFIIYMNDMSVASSLFKAILYADDSTLCSTLCSFNSMYNMDEGTVTKSLHINMELSKISDWLKLNKLSLNASKSKYMVFHTSQKHVVYPKLEIDLVMIEQVEKFNFLELILNEHLNWKCHIEYISSKISR